MRINQQACALLGALLLGSGAHAASLPGVSVSGGAHSDYGPVVVGYRFLVNQTITVTALGAYDAGGDGFAAGMHGVGLWNLAGDWLANTTVDDSAALDGGFRYRPIDPVTLQAGQTYVVGANLYGGYYRDAFLYNASISSGPAVTYLTAAYSNTLQFFYPADTYPANGYFGGNFLYEAPSAVPEPAAALLMTAGLAALALIRRPGRRSGTGRWPR